jgi:hypothetical protein
MGRPLYQAIEKAVHAAGELALEGLKLTFREKEGQEVQASVEEFDEEAQAFLVREHGEAGSKTKIVSPHVFKVGMLSSLPSAEIAKFLAAWDEHVEPLLRGVLIRSPIKEKGAKQIHHEGDKGESQSILGSGRKEEDRPKRSASRRSRHSAASIGRKRSATGDFQTPDDGEEWKQPQHGRDRRSEQGRSFRGEIEDQEEKTLRRPFPIPGR